MNALLLLAASNTCPNPAASAAAQMDCGFYFDCLESQYHCGPSGYPVGYGGKYCNRFKSNINNFSPEGQKWIQGTLTCLKESILSDVIHPDGKTCDDVKREAFQSHVHCYVQNGFCDLAFNFGHPIANGKFIKDLMGVYQVRDFASLVAIEQIGAVLKQCTFPSSGLQNLMVY